MDEPETDPAVERLASGMAHLAGVSWDRLDYYPGYLRGRWREDARMLLRMIEERQPRR